VAAVIKPKRGRPPLPPGAGRTVRIEWRTHAATKALAQRAAKSAGMSLSEWVDNKIKEKTHDT